jgi:hypothetical protein
MRILGVYAYWLKIKAYEKFYRRHISDIGNHHIKLLFLHHFQSLGGIVCKA